MFTNTSDTNMTLEELKTLIQDFVTERDWEQFHAPKSLSMAIAVEAAELMEKFLWLDNAQSYEELEKNRQEIEDEVADILIATIALCNRSSINIAHALLKKLEEIKKKYPAAQVRGSYAKYTAYRMKSKNS